MGRKHVCSWSQQRRWGQAWKFGWISTCLAFAAVPRSGGGRRQCRRKRCGGVAPWCPLLHFHTHWRMQARTLGAKRMLLIAVRRESLPVCCKCTIASMAVRRWSKRLVHVLRLVHVSRVDVLRGRYGTGTKKYDSIWPHALSECIAAK